MGPNCNRCIYMWCLSVCVREKWGVLIKFLLKKKRKILLFDIWHNWGPDICITCFKISGLVKVTTWGRPHIWFSVPCVLHVCHNTGLHMQTNLQLGLPSMTKSLSKMASERRHFQTRGSFQSASLQVVSNLEEPQGTLSFSVKQNQRWNSWWYRLHQHCFLNKKVACIYKFLAECNFEISLLYPCNSWKQGLCFAKFLNADDDHSV